MKDRYLEVTFRRGKPLAAYLYLPRPPRARSVRTQEAGPGLRIDYDASGRPLGLEITAPGQVTLEAVNGALGGLGLPPLGPEELAPLKAA